MNGQRFLAMVLVGSVVLFPRLAVAAQPVVFQTSVDPVADEDIASACQYELTLMNSTRPIRAVWVIFDRGRDMLRYYGDPDVQTFADRNDWALLFPFQCRAKSAPDMNVIPAKGLGRSLFAALTQFAESSHHPELASAKLILLGFSGAGALAARFPEFAPDRIAAVIAADPGHFDPVGVDTITLSPQAVQLPQLILTGSADSRSGTQRPYSYFRKYFDQHAPWTFVIQNGTPHCCIINAKTLILNWLDAVVLHHLNRDTGWYGFITTRASDITESCTNPWCRSATDSWGGGNWSATTAVIQRQSNAPHGMIAAGWLPTHAFAKEWLAFVRQPGHPVASLP